MISGSKENSLWWQSSQSLCIDIVIVLAFLHIKHYHVKCLVPCRSGTRVHYLICIEPRPLKAGVWCVWTCLHSHVAETFPAEHNARMGPHDFEVIMALRDAIGILVVCRHLCRDYEGGALLDRVRRRVLQGLPVQSRVQ